MYKLIKKIKNAIIELEQLEKENWIEIFDSQILNWKYYLDFKCWKFRYLNVKYNEVQMNNLLNNLYTHITLLTK